MSETTKNYRESAPGGGEGGPHNNYTPNDRGASTTPMLIFPGVCEEYTTRSPVRNSSSNHSNSNSNSNSNIGIHHRYDATQMDYRIAQAWISSAPTTAVERTNAPNVAEIENQNLHNGNGADQTAREEFEDEFPESLENQNRNNNAFRNSFQELRRNLFSYPSVGARQQTQTEDKQEVKQEENMELNLSWCVDNEAGHRIADEHHKFDSWLVQNQPVDVDASIPSTPPSIPNDLMDLSSNMKNNRGSDNEDDDYESFHGDDENNDPKLNGSSSFKAVANPEDAQESPFLWMMNPQPQVPDEIVLDDDQRANMEDELLTGDGENSSSKIKHVQAHDPNDSNPNLFRPPTLGTPTRPMPIRHDDRAITPQSWHTPISMLPRAIAYRNTSGGSRRTRGSVPLSPGSRRSVKSEKFYHSYETNPATTPKPVPPFVVVRSGGSAMVTVTPKRTTLVTPSSKPSASKPIHKRVMAASDIDGFIPEENNNRCATDCGCDGDPSTRTKVWCRTWGRPVTIALTTAVLALAIITVVTSLVASRNRDKELQQLRPSRPPEPPAYTTQSIQPEIPTELPAALPSDRLPDLVLDANRDNSTGLDVLWEGVLKRPYEDTENPAEVRPTLPPRTFPPSVSPYAEYPIPTSAPSMLPENFPEFVPTNLPFLIPRTPEPSMSQEVIFDDDEGNTLLQIPWNNYVIGLLSVESPTTFSYLDDATSPQFLALQWISVDSSRKGGSMAYTMHSSLQRFALATIYFALGGDTWIENDSWLSTVVPLCEWTGVSCGDDSALVRTVDLSSNGLSGTLPDELNLLKALRVLNISGNSIGGSLPPGFFNLFKLEEINLSGNLLTGSLPEEYGNDGSFESLKTLNVCSNKITGTIPSTLGSIRNLKSLKLGHNLFTGELPEEICNLESHGWEQMDVVTDCKIGCKCCIRCCGGGDDDSSCC